MHEISPRERLYEVFSRDDGDVVEKVENALAVGREYFDLPIGFFTRIEDGRQEFVCVTGEHELIESGETCPLNEAYCHQTIKTEGVLAVQQVSDSPISRRARDLFDLGTYIGTKVVVDEDTYGTICFADTEERSQPFSEAEELFLELLATLVSTAIDRQTFQSRIEARNDQLLQEKERFRGIAENSFDILFRVGLEAQFTYVSAAVERVLGYEPTELTGERFFDFITETAAMEAGPAYLSLLNGEEVEELELEFLDSAGDAVAVEVNATPITDGDDIVGIQGVGRDISARKERERELGVKNRAMDEADIGISIADPHQPDEPLIYANRGFERVTGYSADAAVGRNCRFLQGEETNPETVEQFREAIAQEAATTVEVINYRADGTPFWNRVQLNPVFDEQGELRHYLGFQQDVTERRRTEQLIQLLNRVLRHNLRNDMNIINGWATMVSNSEDAAIREAGVRIERVSEELMALSEHARELEHLASRDTGPKRLDPNELVRGVVDTHQNSWPESVLDVTIRTDRHICAGVELEDALLELLENTVKHGDEPATRVELVVREDEDWIEIVVVDDGPGIDETEARVITAGEETALEHSSGLGLWLVNWIATRYGGSFRISSRGDDTQDGTTATIRLPAITETQEVEDVARAPTILFR